MLLHKGPLQNFDVNALEAQVVKGDRLRLRLALGGAILLHASSALGLTFWEPSEPVAPPGDMVITIDLAPAMMSTAVEESAGETTASVPQQETPPEPEPEKVEEEVIEEVPEPEPVPEPEIVQEEIAETPKAEKAVVSIAPKKKKEEPKKELRKPRPPAPSQAASAASQTRSDVGGSGAKASPSDLANYVGRVRAALERSKRYPSAAGGASGTAALRFTINRSGQVTGFTIVRSSGNAALDAAARAMLHNASLPPIPEGLPATLTVGAPVNFRVR